MGLDKRTKIWYNTYGIRRRTMMRKDWVKLTILVPRELREAAKAKALAEDTTISHFVRRKLREWVKGEPTEEEEKSPE